MNAGLEDLKVELANSLCRPFWFLIVQDPAGNAGEKSMENVKSR
jgi:hypothetical protein